MFGAFIYIFLVFSQGSASISTDSVGEGSILGIEPVPTDTVRDTSFHVGDTLKFDDGTFCVKPDPSKRLDVAYPSVHTDIKIIAGDGFAHGWITQTFYNPYTLPFNATYVFPMPFNGAVHAMSFTSRLGSFKAILTEKAQAESLFNAAQQSGQQAALLTQTQRSIFTQQLANILPHDSIKVTITFSMALSYSMDEFEISYPTTIGHRYGAAPLAKRADVIDPVYIKPGVRPANSLDFSILLCTPFPITGLVSPNFAVTVSNADVEALARQNGVLSGSDALPASVQAQFVKLSASGELPNRDIVVRYKRLSTARDLSLLSWHNGTSGYFAMQLYPDIADSVNRPNSIDMVFVIDQSGSMAGTPMELSKKIVNSMLDKATSDDRIFPISFDNTPHALFVSPQMATPENIQKTRGWVNTLAGTGGTEMLAAVRLGLSVPLVAGSARVMALITDGGIYAVDSIYKAIKDDGKTTAFAFGVGASPNSDLINGAATAGNGIGQNIGYNDDVATIVSNFWTRIRTPQLEDISIDWGASPPTELTKTTFGNLWVGAPLVLFGKYSEPGTRTLTINGTRSGQPFSQSFSVTFSSECTVLDFVPKLWARQTIENLLYAQTLAGNENNKAQILSLSLEYGVLCKYTAFVAIADTAVADNPAISGKVPLVIPQGTDPSLYNYNSGAVTSAQEDSPGQRHATGQLPDGKSFSAVQCSGRILFHINSAALHDPTARVRIFDMRGRLIRSWLVSELAAGGFSWTLTTGTNGMRIKRGTYLVTLSGATVRAALPLAVR
jgi:Ca-activated chloride channel family protein